MQVPLAQATVPVGRSVASRAHGVSWHGSTARHRLKGGGLAPRVYCRSSRRALPAGVILASAAESPRVHAVASVVPPQPAVLPRVPIRQDAVPGIHGKPARGEPEPFGASATSEGANFAVFSSNATAVSLVFFTPEDRATGRVTAEIELDPLLNRTGSVWHVVVPDLLPSLLYGYRVRGPSEPHRGQRFNPDAVLVDPCASAVVSRPQFGVPAPGGECWPQMASPVPLPLGAAPAFDWQGSSSPSRPMEELIIYEMHVRGFTAHESSGVAAPGTYSGVVEKIPHLQRMGFNAIELLPIHEFNEVEYWAAPTAAAASTRCNFWGYSTMNFYAPMARYASQPAATGDGGRGVCDEVRSMVRACHQAGIEVILDVVFNHTAEGNEHGPTVSFRGLDNRVYYMTAPEGQFYNYSGCGNTVNCNHPVVREFVRDCLRHWALEYRIDGFRFDLAAIMTRAPSQWELGPPVVSAELAESLGVPGAPIVGAEMAAPPLVDLISNDGILRTRKLIAEAWDAGGLYQVGSFGSAVGPLWSEWNGKYRDGVRQFLKGTDGFAGDMAERICGSPQLYAAGGRAPRHSVNFVTAHDGFTLRDLVSYNQKHNEPNGEGNRDGEDHNLSWNCGEGDPDEGQTAKPHVAELRQRQMRNFLAALMLSQGVPMIHMGDEYGHSKGGNNNTYCHDGTVNYFDWAQAEADRDGLVRFCAALARLRRATPQLRLLAHPTGQQIAWHGHQPGAPDWSEASRFVAYSLAGLPADAGRGGGALPVYVAFNASHLPAVVTLPPAGPALKWRLAVDTALPPPFDAIDEGDTPAGEVAAARAQHRSLERLGIYVVADRSCVVMRAVPLAEPAAPQAAPAQAAAPPQGAAPAA